MLGNPTDTKQPVGYFQSIGAEFWSLKHKLSQWQEPGLKPAHLMVYKYSSLNNRTGHIASDPAWTISKLPEKLRDHHQLRLWLHTWLIPGRLSIFPTTGTLLKKLMTTGKKPLEKKEQFYSINNLNKTQFTCITFSYHPIYIDSIRVTTKTLSR